MHSGPVTRVITVAAFDIQKERPDLAGLALLRKAIQTLPKDRQRTLISLSQAEWFEPGLEIETKIRVAAGKRGAGEDDGDGNRNAVLQAQTATANGIAALDGFHRSWAKGHLDGIEWFKQSAKRKNEYLKEIAEAADQTQIDQVLVCSLLGDIVRELHEIKSLLLAAPVFAAVRELAPRPDANLTQEGYATVADPNSKNGPKPKA